MKKIAFAVASHAHRTPIGDFKLALLAGFPLVRRWTRERVMISDKAGELPCGRVAKPAGRWKTRPVSAGGVGEFAQAGAFGGAAVWLWLLGVYGADVLHGGCGVCD